MSRLFFRDLMRILFQTYEPAIVARHAVAGSEPFIILLSLAE